MVQIPLPAMDFGPRGIRVACLAESRHPRNGAGFDVVFVLGEPRHSGAPGHGEDIV